MNVKTSEGWTTIGHDWAVRSLQRAVIGEATSHAYLFTGPPGVGKTTLALDLASALLCERPQLSARPCGACRACRLVRSGNHPDLHLLESKHPGDSLKIERVRELTHRLSLTPVEGERQVAVLNRFHEATSSAANALLKTLEEPPSYVVLLVLAREADLLLPTIVSRCQHVPLRPLPIAVVEDALVERWGASRREAELLSHLSGGRLGWAADMLEDSEALSRRSDRLRDLSTLVGATVVKRFEYAQTLARDPIATRETLDLWIGWWRDVLLVASGSRAPLANIDCRDQIRNLAQALDVSDIVTVIDALRAAHQKLQRNANRRLTLEVLMLDLPRL